MSPKENYKYILDEIYSNASQIRLTLDYQEDYWLLKSIQNILGNQVWYMPYLPAPRYQTQIQIQHQFL